MDDIDRKISTHMDVTGEIARKMQEAEAAAAAAQAEIAALQKAHLKQMVLSSLNCEHAIVSNQCVKCNARVCPMVDCKTVIPTVYNYCPNCGHGRCFFCKKMSTSPRFHPCTSCKQYNCPKCLKTRYVTHPWYPTRHDWPDCGCYFVERD